MQSRELSRYSSDPYGLYEALWILQAIIAPSQCNKPHVATLKPQGQSPPPGKFCATPAAAYF